MIGLGDLRFGDVIKHNKVGEITVLGFTPHCGDFAISYIKDGIDGWVYLKNCRYVGSRI